MLKHEVRGLQQQHKASQNAWGLVAYPQVNKRNIIGQLQDNFQNFPTDINAS